MTEVKRYKAMTTVPKSDPFAGGQQREVQGYYVKHVTATPYPLGTQEEHDQFVAEHTKHFIMFDGFSDWGLSRPLEIHEIDINTLEEL